MMMEMRRRALVGAGRVPRLPPEYQEVEWIGGNGNQCIDSGIIPSSDTGFKVKWYTNAVRTQQRVMGAVGTHSVNHYLHSLGGFGFRYNTSGGAQSGAYAKNVAYESIHNPRTNYIDIYNNGELVATRSDGSNGSFVCETHLYVLNGGNNTSGGLNGGVYEASVYDYVIGNQRMYIPCYRLSDIEIGMYDLCGSLCPLTGTPFYINAGTGTFTKGADVL